MGRGQGARRGLTNMDVEVEMLFACLLVPLSVSIEMEEIILVAFDGGGSLSMDYQNLEASLMYRAKEEIINFRVHVPNMMGRKLGTKEG